MSMEQIDKLGVDTFMFENQLCEFIEEVAAKQQKSAYKKLTIDGVEWEIDEVKYDGLNIEVVAVTKNNRLRAKREV